MVSVIVPVYNAEIYLDACVDSILKQTYEDFELLIIDDGSTDHSAEICDDFQKKDARIKVVYNENHGVSYTRNTGLLLAKGDFIAFCDADDMYEKDYLQKLIDAAENQAADIVICNYSYFRQTGRKTVSNRPSGFIEKDEIYRRIFIDNTIGGFVWNKLFSRKTIKDVKFDSNMQICEDTYFLCKVLNNAKKIYYVGKPLYNYRLHSSSVMASVRNMFTTEGDLKYAVVYERLVNENIIPKQYVHYVYANECVLAIGVKCDVLNSNMDLEKDMKHRLNGVIIRNYGSMLRCPNYSTKKKLVYIGNSLFNLRRFKNKINRGRGTAKIKS